MTGKRVIILSTLMIFLSIAAILSCVSNNEEDLYGIKPCDLTNIAWTSKISDIMQKNCVVCHGPDLAFSGIRTDTYGAILIIVEDGRLRGVVNHLAGYLKMPKDRDKLPECELNQINIWLDNGAPEN